MNNDILKEVLEVVASEAKDLVAEAESVLKEFNIDEGEKNI